MISYFVGGANSKLNLYRKLLWISQKNGWRVISKLISNRIQLKFNMFLPANHQVPLSAQFPHPTGIVIGEGVMIAENVIIYQGVTLGGARRGDWERGSYPTIEDGVTIFAGAVVIGKITIGRDSVIAANAVVTKDVPSRSTAVGVPARIVKMKNL